MPRRSWHEGTVYKRPDRSYFEGSVRLGGRRYHVTGRTRQEVVDKIRELVSRHAQGALAPPSKLTLGEWLRDWLRQGEGRWRPTTYRRRSQALAPVVASLGSVRLQRLSPLHVLRTLEEMREQGVGSRTVQLAHATLHAALEAAREMGLIADNPVARVPKPRHQPREATDWSLEDMRRFLAVALEDCRPLAWGLALMLMTGLRPGEMLGLRWEDVDFDAEALKVRRAITWAGSTWHEGPPKTRAGVRAVALPVLALEVLSCLPKGEGYVFWNGQPPTTRSVSRLMARLCEKAAVPRRPAHYLRHAHAALLVHLGADVKTAQHRLGHSTAALTLDVYAHHVGGGERRLARLLDEALGGRQA